MRNRNTTIMILVLFALLAFRSITSGGYGSVGDWLIEHILMMPGIILGLSLHEFGHAWVSSKCGDPTPERQGRLTVSPLAHIDPIGFVSLIFLGFGWGKPVQIDPRYYGNRRRDEALVAVAGVVMNLIVAVIFTIIAKILITVSPRFFVSTNPGQAVFNIVEYCIYINLVLMVFNLLPIPPLDGFNLVTQIFDLRKYNWWWNVYTKGYFILIIFVACGLTRIILSPILSAIYGVITRFLLM
ncbi:MAG: site-2 protease family protein [Firmicutes bacterium]|nr:site-2 protease family protein [Bacillota bacterium]